MLCVSDTFQSVRLCLYEWNDYTGIVRNDWKWRDKPENKRTERTLNSTLFKYCHNML